MAISVLATGPDQASRGARREPTKEMTRVFVRAEPELLPSRCRPLPKDEFHGQISSDHDDRDDESR